MYNEHTYVCDIQQMTQSMESLVIKQCGDSMCGAVRVVGG